MPAKKSTKKVNTSKKSTAKKAVSKKNTRNTKQKQSKRTTKTKVSTINKNVKAKGAKKSSNKKTKVIRQKMPNPKKLTLNYMNLVQFLLEFIVASGFFFGIFGYYYDLLGYYCVLPLTLVNFVISLIENNRTISYSAINMVMALIAFYPGVGLFAKLAGICLSISSIAILSGRLHE